MLFPWLNFKLVIVWHLAIILNTENLSIYLLIIYLHKYLKLIGIFSQGNFLPLNVCSRKYLFLSALLGCSLKNLKEAFWNLSASFIKRWKYFGVLVQGFRNQQTHVTTVDPLGRPTVKASRNYYFHTSRLSIYLYVCLYVRFQIMQYQTNFKWCDCGLDQRDHWCLLSC